MRGSVELGDRQIRSVDQGASGVSQAIDAEGDFLAPGRQWRELPSHKRYTMGTTGMSEAEFDAHLAKRIAEGGISRIIQFDGRVCAAIEGRRFMSPVRREDAVVLAPVKDKGLRLPLTRHP